MNIRKLLKTGTLVSLALVTLSACAERQDEETPEEHGKYLPFAIKFDPDGNPVVVDEKGRAIKPSDVSFPIKATEIERFETLSYVQYRGSHVALIRLNGRLYSIPLPH